MKLEEVLTVHVKIGGKSELRNDRGDSVVMITFTGHATGRYFEGNVLDGGVDTQIIGQSGGRHRLSARYILQGRDYTGQSCEIYIENNGMFNSNPDGVLFRTHPVMITNSEALSFLNDAVLIGEGRGTDTGVEIKIYRAL